MGIVVLALAVVPTPGSSQNALCPPQTQPRANPAISTPSTAMVRRNSSPSPLS